MKLITAHDLRTGAVVYWTNERKWAPSLEQAAALDDEAADAELVTAKSQPTLVTNAYLVAIGLDGTLGLPYEWVETSVIKGETRTPEFLALNPVGQVPLAVLPDGRKLAQSNAIMLWLAEGSRLIPEDKYERARMFEWLFWEQYNHEPSIATRRFRVAYQRKPESEVEPHLFPRGEAALARMELQLGETPYIVGDKLSLADVALVAYTRVAEEGGFTLSKYPAVVTWIARVERDLGLSPVSKAA